MKRVSGLLMAVVLLSCAIIGCRKEPSVHEMVSRLSDVAELGTVEYSVKKVISANDTSLFKIGDRKIYFTCMADVKAGIDLSNFSEKDVKAERSSGSVVITLPHAKILSIELPPDKIEEKYCSVTGFRWDFTPEEKRTLLKQGEEDILAKAEQSGILADAERNSEEFFKALFSEFGYDKVTVRFE